MCTWSPWPIHACGEVINWGDVPTAAATLFAAVAAWFALRALRLEQDRDTQREAEEQRAQAVRVTVFFERTKNGTHQLVIRNVSDQPITATAAYVVVHGKEQPVHSSPAQVGPGHTEAVEILDPDDKDDDYLERTLGFSWGSFEDWGKQPFPRETLQLPFGVRFTDASGWRRWNLKHDGRLTWENRPVERRWWQLGGRNPALRDD